MGLFVAGEVEADESYFGGRYEAGELGILFVLGLACAGVVAVS